MKHLYPISLLLASTGLVQIATATPPLPPEGKRWVLNEAFSDEFNGEELDQSIWYDHHPKWHGREPGIFLPSQVAVKDGFMTITSKILDEPIVRGKSTYTIAGGAVTSRSFDASFGYYECRFKAAATTMSTTFWLSTRKQAPAPEEKGNYGLELDIQECIGRGGNFAGNHFASGMNANSHFWYNEKGKETQDLRATHVKFDSDELASASFNTYGGWWKDESNVSFYYNNSEPKHMAFNDDIKKKPFDQKMAMNLVSESYPFPWIELPNEKELNDPAINTCYYDWVRSYTLVDAFSPVESGGKALPAIYDEKVVFAPENQATLVDGKLQLRFSYRANRDLKLHISATAADGATLASRDIKAPAGFAFASTHLDLPEGTAGKVKKITITLVDGDQTITATTTPLKHAKRKH